MISKKNSKKIVAFHTYQMAPRGVDVACFDYAFYNEKILGNKSLIYAPKSAQHEPQVMKKYQNNFTVRLYENLGQLEEIAKYDKVDVFYAIKSGADDGLLISGCKNVVHAVFPDLEPHGDTYACISNWLRDTRPDLDLPVVPHIVQLPQTRKTLRSELCIPTTAKVYGAMGGENSFDLEFAISEIVRKLERRSNTYFLALGIKVTSKNVALSKRIESLKHNKKIIEFSPTTSVKFKSEFINTCDAMLHARRLGETFGLAIAEFSLLGKPIITCARKRTRDRAHINMLGVDGNYYSNRFQLRWLLSKDPRKLKVSKAYNTRYSPDTVMRCFRDVFLT